MSGGVGLCSSQRSRWMSIHSSIIGTCDRLICKFSRTESAFCNAFSSAFAIAPSLLQYEPRRHKERAAARRHHFAADLLRVNRAADAHGERVLDPIRRREIEV